MKHLILTSNDSGAGALKGAGFADCVIPFGLRFVWGKLPSPLELETLLSPRSTRHEASDPHWLDNLPSKALKDARAHGLGLIEFCERFESIDLWIDPGPNSQLQLIWLMNYLHPHADIISRLGLVQMETGIADHSPAELDRFRRTAVPIFHDQLETASAAWAAYRARTPVAWFDLLTRDLSAFPRLRDAVIALLEELPMHGTALGATEMRMLELVSTGHVYPYGLFPGHAKPNERKAFGYWEVGALLDGLAHGPAPAVAGLEEGPFTLEMHERKDRHERYKQSRLSLTELGRAFVAQADDFSRHNPIHRWWGGTELTNDRLWRWDPANRTLVAP